LDNIQKLFYRKDWTKDEKEYRLLISADEPKMYKVGTVREILLGTDFSDADFETIISTRDKLCWVTRLARNEDNKSVTLLFPADQLFTIEPTGKENAAKIIGYKHKNAECEIAIPSHYKDGGTTYDVDAIGDDAFNFSNITKIDIPDNVTAIGRRAFWGCTKLKEVKLPTGLRDIGESVFKGCTALSSIDIPEGIVEIQWWSFEGCTSLTEVTIPNSVTEIGGEAFKDCVALKSVTLGKNVQKIDERAFYDCVALLRINIPRSVKEIKEGVFSNCSSMTEITVAPDNKKYIDSDGSLLKENSSILQCCPGGKTGEYYVPKHVITIEQEACCGCMNITKVVIPDSVKKIKKWAFEHCVRLSSVEIPENGIITIDDEAFFECNALNKENHADIETRFGKMVFETAESRGKKRR
jgi:hypothetical protein